MQNKQNFNNEKENGPHFCYTSVDYDVYFRFAQKVKIDAPPIRVENFQTLPAPTTAFSPGYIFRVPKKTKEQVPVVTIGTPADYAPKGYELPDITKKWKTNVLLNFIFSKLFGFTAKKNAEKVIVVSFAGGKIEQMLDTRIDELLKTAGFAFKKGSDYYVINQTLSFDSLGYKVNDYNSFDLDAKNYIDTMKLKTNVTINRTVGDTTKFSQKFSEPHRVFYTVVKVTEKGTAVSGSSRFNFSSSTMMISDALLKKAFK